MTSASEYEPGNAQHVAAMQKRTYAAIGAARQRVATKLGVSVPDLPEPTIPSARPLAWRECGSRVMEEGRNAPTVIPQIVQAFETEAIKNVSLEWLGEKSFSEGAWRTARNRAMSVPTATAAPRERHEDTVIDDDGNIRRDWIDARGNIVRSEDIPAPLREASA